MILEDIIGSAFILIIIVLLLIWLLNIIYKTYIVKATLYKIIERHGNFDYNDKESSVHTTYYYSFITKNGDKKSKTFGGYTFIKKDQSRLIFYSNDKDELVGKIRTPFILLAIIIFLFFGIANIALEICLISILIIILTIVLFVVIYNKKYLNGGKKK